MKTFGLIIRYKSLKIFLVIATMLGMIFMYLDVVEPYLNSAIIQQI